MSRENFSFIGLFCSISVSLDIFVLLEHFSFVGFLKREWAVLLCWSLLTVGLFRCKIGLF